MRPKKDALPYPLETYPSHEDYSVLGSTALGPNTDIYSAILLAVLQVPEQVHQRLGGEDRG